jgi:ribose 5-phosphate isomerase A
MDLERIARQKDAVGRAAAGLVEDGMLVGIGSGSTAARFVVHLAERHLRIRCVAPSKSAEELAHTLGLDVEPWEALPSLGRLDLAVDGADQVAPDGWVVKGGGGAHRRERIIARAADRFVVIVDSSKIVPRIGPPIPLELEPDRLADALAALEGLGGAGLRDGWPPSPDGGIIADFVGPVGGPAEMADQLARVPGVLDHGLFGPDLVSLILVARNGRIETFR